MMTPKVMRQSLYKHAFSIYIRERDTGRKIFGTFRTLASSKVRRAQATVFETPEELNLDFDILVTRHTARELVLKLNFQSQNDVTTENQNIYFEFNDPSMFKSKDTHSQLILAPN